MYIEQIRCSKFGCYILTNNSNEPIVSMTIQYIGPIRVAPNYLQRCIKKQVCHRYGFKNERLICGATDGHADTWADGQG